jgi:zinc/manganese transport system ATP-binding protein
MTAISLHDVTLGYEGHVAVRHLTGRFAQGSMTAIIGPNGSGKSTLLKAMAGLLKPMQGNIVATGNATAFLPQGNSIEPTFPATVEDLVSLGLWRKHGWFSGLSHNDHHAVHHALATVGLDGFATRSLEGLSGGQLQRVLFARLYLQDCPVILLDEPFSAIDQHTVEDMMALLRQWQAKGRTILAVLHDMALVSQHFPQTLLLAREMIGWGATHTVLTAENLHKARILQENWNSNAPWCHKDVA